MGEGRHRDHYSPEIMEVLLYEFLLTRVKYPAGAAERARALARDTISTGPPWFRDVLDAHKKAHPNGDAMEELLDALEPGFLTEARKIIPELKDRPYPIYGNSGLQSGCIVSRLQDRTPLTKF